MRTTTAGHWATLDAQRARLAAHRTLAVQRGGVPRAEVEAIAMANDSKPLPVSSSDHEIAATADRRAQWMGERVSGLSSALSDADTIGVLNAWLGELQARPFMPACKWAGNVRGALARVQCAAWWRRQIRRDVVRRAEAQAIDAGRVSATAGQWYVSNETVRKRLRQNARNALILESTELENDLGQVFTLKALAEKGTANKAIRRGELMTRIRGCEEWAESEGHTGLFLTLTCPSRFHSTMQKTGARNPRYGRREWLCVNKHGPALARPLTPRDGQDWLCRTWADVRAKLQRAGLKPYGFRVAEPHHDGCPHWHALVWMPDADVKAFKAIVHRWWRRDAGHEPGARKVRVQIKRMDHGGASGYVAKYIAKNIDDAGSVGTEGHTDADFAPPQSEMFDNGALRVEAWAAAWGIRQFQAIGQPPVTVWRELRRVPVESVQLGIDGSGPARIALALDAVNRREEDRADWATYVQVQGGTNTGREYRILIGRQVEDFAGRYETAQRAKPLGVYELGAPELLVQSVRREWKPREKRRGLLGPKSVAEMQRVAVLLDVKLGQGATAKPEAGESRSAQRAAPWTRVNNCTRGNFGGVVAELLARLDAVRQVPFSDSERWQT